MSHETLQKSPYNSALVCLLVLLSLSCTNWPYKPNEFFPPKLPPAPNAFVSKDSLYAFTGTGTRDVKFAYTLTPTGGSKTIYFADFNDSIVLPKELKKPVDKLGWDANCPIISPDGKLITYYLASGTTQVAVYCQPLDTNAAPTTAIGDPGSEPHFFKDSQGNLFITYNDATGTQLSNDTTLTGYHTYKQKIDPVTGQKIGTNAILADFPFYGGMSVDGNYICTGYSTAYIYNLLTHKFFAINAPNQTCNPSMTPDSIVTGRMMFLNFGGHEKLNNLPPEDTGKVGEHQIIFIADTNNNYTNGFNLAISLPSYFSNDGEWQCPKWTNVPDFFCALATNGIDISKQGGLLYNCYLISTSSKKMLMLNKPALLQFESSSKPYVYIGVN